MRHPAGSLLRRIEWISYDWRAHWVHERHHLLSEELGVMSIDDRTLEAAAAKMRLSYPFPRWLHGAALRELAAQGAAGVGYDVFFVDEKPGETMPGRNGTAAVPSDDLFAREIERFGRVFLAAPGNPLGRDELVAPAPVFSKGAAGIGHALRLADEDGIARRVAPAHEDPKLGRVWTLGFALAASHRGYDLDTAVIDDDEIRVRDATGRLLSIPLDGAGRLVIPWRVDVRDSRFLRSQGMESVLGSAAVRAKEGADPNPAFKDRLVLVGSTGSSPLIADMGPTPIGTDTPFLSVHFNVAEALLSGRFIRPLGWAGRIAILCLLLPVVALASWKLRALWATVATLAVGAGYVSLSFWLFESKGYWLPMAVPVIGVVMLTHALMVGFRFFVELRSRSRMKGWFGSVMSRDSLELLLGQEPASWEPEEREMTVFFADIRGFSTFAERAQPDAPRDPAEPLPAGGGERGTLQAVNACLAAIADTIKGHGATIDKYMGDSVMAFWNAPLTNPRHAAGAVRAAIAAMRKVENTENSPESTRLRIGIALNTGVMTAGVMGSERNPSNYTVFGREVNVAARLQGEAPAGCILVSAATREAAVRQDPGLDGLFQPAGELKLKGIDRPVPAFEVRWRKEEVPGEAGERKKEEEKEKD